MLLIFISKAGSNRAALHHAASGAFALPELLHQHPGYNVIAKAVHGSEAGQFLEIPMARCPSSAIDNADGLFSSPPVAVSSHSTSTTNVELRLHLQPQDILGLMCISGTESGYRTPAFGPLGRQHAYCQDIPLTLLCSLPSSVLEVLSALVLFFTTSRPPPNSRTHPNRILQQAVNDHAKSPAPS